MSQKPQIYDSAASYEFSLDTLLDCFSANGVERVIYKNLAPNDNSKNQPYLAADFSDIGFIPCGALVPSTSTSLKKMSEKRRTKFTASLKFNWIAPDGRLFSAPNAKLIYYPQFPEVRLSGFLKGCMADLGKWMDPGKFGRSLGRVLIMGIKRDGNILAYLAVPDSRISREISDWEAIPLTSLLNRLIPKVKQLPMFAEVAEPVVSYEVYPDERNSSDETLINELRRIHLKGPIVSKRLDKQGMELAYKARNGGGYTLEAELGIIPNGIAEPDYLGWEIKQFGVKRFDLINSKPLTVMTPEPDGGIYADMGAKSFVLNYGNTRDGERYDFTGRHLTNQLTEKTGLKMVMNGFDEDLHVMTDASGYIGLIDSKDNLTASWSFSKLLEHWKRKHAKAVYIPSIASDTSDGYKAYHYGNNIRMFEGTSINMLLKALQENNVYYDPGIKVESVSSGGKVKARSQFRIKSGSLDCLYLKKSEVDLIP